MLIEVTEGGISFDSVRSKNPFANSSSTPSIPINKRKEILVNNPDQLKITIPKFQVYVPISLITTQLLSSLIFRSAVNNSFEAFTETIFAHSFQSIQFEALQDDDFSSVIITMNRNSSS